MNNGPRSVTRWLGAAALLALLPGRIAAHGLHYPKRLKIRVSGAELQVALDYDVEPGPEALALRDRFDTDADGKLDERERRGLREFLVAKALRPLQLHYGGRELRLQETDRWGYGDEESARSSSLIGVHLELRADLPRGKKAAELLLADSIPDSAHQVAVNLTVAAPWNLASYGAGQISGESSAAETVLKSIYLDAGKPVRFVLDPRGA
jgi:hypothetical protein